MRARARLLRGVLVDPVRFEVQRLALRCEAEQEGEVVQQPRTRDRRERVALGGPRAPPV